VTFEELLRDSRGGHWCYILCGQRLDGTWEPGTAQTCQRCAAARVALAWKPRKKRQPKSARQWVNRWVLPEARCVALEEVRVLVAENMVKHYGQHDDALLADGFEDALLGFGRQFNVAVAVYDYERCLAVLRDRDGMSEDGALEFFEFNVAGAYVGPHTPIFMSARHGHDRT
jgi:hypothetical protein